MTLTNIDRAIKKIEIAIDKMVDLQDMGINSDEVKRVLEILKSLRNQLGAW